MDNLNQLQIVILSDDKQDVEAYLGDVSTDQFIKDMKAFNTSKLETAALMIAQGLCADSGMDSINIIPAMAVKIAMRVLEEANK